MRRFFLFLLIAALLVGVGTLAGAAYSMFAKPTFFVQTLIFLVFSTGLLFVYLYKADKPEYFVQFYLLSMTLKLLAYCCYCLVIIFEDRSGAISNMAFFIVCYFIFTALEIGFLYRKINARK